MFRALRLRVRRTLILADVADLLDTSLREGRAALRPELDWVLRRPGQGSWNARSAAGLVAGASLARRAAGCDFERRKRIAEKLVIHAPGQDEADIDYLGELQTGRVNTVGMDPLLLAFHRANGRLSDWRLRGLLSFDVKPVFLAGVAWGLAGLATEEVMDRLDAMLDDAAELPALPVGR